MSDIIIRDAKGVVQERISIEGCPRCTEDGLCSTHEERVEKARERVAEYARDDDEDEDGGVA